MDVPSLKMKLTAVTRLGGLFISILLASTIIGEGNKVIEFAGILSSLVSLILFLSVIMRYHYTITHISDIADHDKESLKNPKIIKEINDVIDNKGKVARSVGIIFIELAIHDIIVLFKLRNAYFYYYPSNFGIAIIFYYLLIVCLNVLTLDHISKSGTLIRYIREIIKIRTWRVSDQ